MSSTITGTVTSGVTIGSGTYTSPLTIAAGAEVSLSASGTAVSSATLATVVDYGTVSATASPGGVGVALAAGGHVNLGTAGFVTAYSDGIKTGGTLGTVANAGTIEATGMSGIGVDLAAGGSVDNSGLIAPAPEAKASSITAAAPRRSKAGTSASTWAAAAPAR